VIIQHYGDSILPYLINDVVATKNNKTTNLPIIVRSKIKYASIRTNINGRFGDKHSIFPDSSLRGPRQEIK
jgi:hypothetical protein